MSNNIYDFSNTGISKLIEQMQQISLPVVEMVNSLTFKTSIQSIIHQNEIMQEYFRNNTIENVIKPTLELYKQQMQRISYIMPKIITPNICNTLLLYRNVLDEINFNDLKINDNGTIEYEGDFFAEDEVEKTSTELIKEIEENKNFKIDTVLKKIIISFFITFATFFIMSGNDVEWMFIAIASGFFGQIGANMFDFFKKSFFKNYECKEKDKDTYFRENSAIVKLEELKVRKQPCSDEKIIGIIYFSQLVRILDIKPYWIKIEYKDRENNISINGWVSKKGLKRFNTLTSQFEDIEDEKLGV